MTAQHAEQALPLDFIITDVEVNEDKMLGEGAYGVVKLGQFHGLNCAVKKLKPSMFPAGMQQLDQQTELILQSFYNECDKMSRIRHPNVVQLLGVFPDSYNKLPVIVMELMNESLSRLLHRTKVLPFHVEINIVHDVAQALAYLHSFKAPIVHRDLSSNNILLADNYRAKVTDLGVAKVAKRSFMSWNDTPAPGTLVYMPPEVRKVPADLTPAMDVFAIGVNMIQIKTHKFPRPGPEFTSGRLGFSKMVPEKDRRRDHLDLISRRNLFKPVILDCIRDNPRDRPSALKLCERLVMLKREREYSESVQMARLTDSHGVDGLKDQVILLEKLITQLTEELVDKSSLVERLERDLGRERGYSSQLLEQNTRDRLKFDMTLAGMTASADSGISASPPSTESKMSMKKKRKHMKLKKLLPKPPPKPSRRYVKRTESMPASKGRSREPSSSDGSPSSKSVVHSTKSSSKHKQSRHKEKEKKSITRFFSFTLKKIPGKAGAVDITEVVLEDKAEEEEEEEEEDEEEEEEEEVAEEDERGGIDGRLLNSKPLQQCDKIDYKLNRLTWYTHRCLPIGLQGSTLRVHQFSDQLCVCGGVTADSNPNKSLIYCPITNLTSWKRVQSDVPQYFSSSVIMQDELLLISGVSAVDGKLTGALSSYNFNSHVWVQRYPPLPVPLSSTSAFIYHDCLVVIGGQDEQGEVVRMVNVLHLSSHVWESATQLPIPMAGASTVVCENIVYLVGGVGLGSLCTQSVQCADLGKLLSSCHRFSLLSGIRSDSSNVWKQLHDCPFTKMTVTCSGNQLLAFGGEQLTCSVRAEPAEWIWIYDKDEDTWSPVQGMPSPRKLCAVTMLPDNMIIIGGDPHFTHIDLAEIS